MKQEHFSIFFEECQRICLGVKEQSELKQDNIKLKQDFLQLKQDNNLLKQDNKLLKLSNNLLKEKIANQIQPGVHIAEISQKN